jgi:hypothetical protein
MESERGRDGGPRPGAFGNHPERCSAASTTTRRRADPDWLSGTSPFEPGPSTVSVNAIAPHAFRTVDTSHGYSLDLTAVHQDWSALSTPDNPAYPGEIVHMYFNGLGPVAPAVAAGEVGPTQPLARVMGGFRCQFWDGGRTTPSYCSLALRPAWWGSIKCRYACPWG